MPLIRLAGHGRAGVVVVIAENLNELRRWLFEAALPLWHRAGEDKASGGFAETIGLDKVASRDDRRGRVNPRMVFVYCEAGRMGWDGPWQAIAERTQHYIEQVYLQPDGFIADLASADGTLLDDTYVLYNQAFYLLGLSGLAARDEVKRAEFCAKADKLLGHLKAHYKHPVAGFQEASPPCAPLGANPHMHFFEMCMEWERAVPLDDARKADWAALVDELGELCLRSFISADTGGLREFFDLDWMPMPGEKGRLLEPGHHFEWAWLLTRWSALRGDDRGHAAAKRLFEIAETHGVDRTRGVAVMGLKDDFSMHDPLARLWSQAEWIKGAISMLEITPEREQARYIQSLKDGIAALTLFLDGVPAGLWRDKLLPNGEFVEEAAPASSLYHIISAISELERFANTERGRAVLSLAV